MTGPAVLRTSAPLYDLLAPTYDEHFAVPHRRAYDDLAWEASTAVLPARPALVVDVGCGVGRWAERLLGAGHRVVGIEPAPGMAAAAAARLAGWLRPARRPGPDGDGTPPFTLLAERVEDVDLPPLAADAVLAMGSLQYCQDPAAEIGRIAGWLRPGGHLVVLVDSLQALALELVAAGRPDEAILRLATRRGVWTVDGVAADLHLFDAASLTAACTGAGLDVVRTAGLLVGASAHGRAELARRLAADYPAALAAERALAAAPALADLGKQLLVVARRPLTA